MPNHPKMFMKSTRAISKNCAGAIKRTLAYAAIFEYPLSFYQLSTYLISDSRYPYDTMLDEINNLIEKKEISIKGARFFLPTVKPKNWNFRIKASLNQLDKKKVAFKILGYIPWIKLLAVSGSVAAFNCTDEDDVDIFIVTQENRLWITRLFLVFFLKTLGIYFDPNNQAGKICPNLLVDTNNMEWPLEQRNLYVAHEILQLQPIISRDDAYFHFMESNRWIFDYMPSGSMHFGLSEPIKIYPRNVLDLLEDVVRTFQIQYMKPKKTTEVVAKGFIHFNKRDQTLGILKKYHTTDI